MISLGILESAGMATVLVATGMDCGSAFDGFEPIPSRGEINDCLDRLKCNLKFRGGEGGKFKVREGEGGTLTGSESIS